MVRVYFDTKNFKMLLNKILLCQLIMFNSSMLNLGKKFYVKSNIYAFFFNDQLSAKMPALAMDTMDTDTNGGEEHNGSYMQYKSSFKEQNSPRSPLNPQSPRSDSIDFALDGIVKTSIEQLYHNVCEMQSSEGRSPSMTSYGSYGEESRIDSELRHLVGDIGETEIVTKEIVEVNKEESVNGGDLSPKKVKESSNGGDLSPKKVSRKGKVQSPARSSSKSKSFTKKVYTISSLKKQRNLASLISKLDESQEGILGNPDLGPFLLKQAREMITMGENPQKTLELAKRALKSFELCADGKPNLDLVMCLHVLAAIYCNLGQYNDAIPVLERSIGIPVLEDGQDHALAKFAGCMQLGDTYAMLGMIENSILCYTAGLEIQKQVLGETDTRVGETCRYLAEAHVQALQFDEAKKFCQMALDIHKDNGPSASIEEAADRKLMGLICDSKGDYESALEHYVLASMALSSAKRHKIDVATVDCSIGDAYLSLSRFDEAVFAYQKALTAFKTAKGENHPSVASVFVRLADLYHKIGKLRDSKTYCENALKIYTKPNPGTPSEEIAIGLIDIAAIYQSMNELDTSLKLLRKSLKLYGNFPGQQSTVAGIEAQIGVMYYMLGNYSESYNTFKRAISKFRASGEKKTALYGISLNQMGLVCVQKYAINEAADLFEEARSILEKEYGPYHHDTLGVYSNLAGTYDAIGRYKSLTSLLNKPF